MRRWPAYVVAVAILALGWAISVAVGARHDVTVLRCSLDPKCQNASERSRAVADRLAELRPVIETLQRRQDKLIADRIAAGLKGRVGPRGHDGVAGRRGETGARGSRGPRGLQGVAGATGPRGRTGAVGPRGPRGPAGLPGPAGEAGATAQEVLDLICTNGGLPPSLCTRLGITPLPK